MGRLFLLLFRIGASKMVPEFLSTRTGKKEPPPPIANPCVRPLFKGTRNIIYIFIYNVYNIYLRFCAAKKQRHKYEIRADLDFSIRLH